MYLSLVQSVLRGGSGYLFAPDSAGAGGGSTTSVTTPSSSPTTPPSSSSSSGAASSTPSGSGSGTVPATPTAPPPAPLTPNQPVPWDRFSEVSSKAEKLAWAESLDKDRTVSANELYEWFDRDPEGAYNYLTDTLTRNGVLKARTPTAPPAAAPAPAKNYRHDTATGEPLPDVQTEDGQLLFSAAQNKRYHQWMQEKFDQRLAPLEGRAETERTNQEAQRMLAEAETWDGFTDNMQDIFKELTRDKRLSLEGAYRRVVVPKLKNMTREAVLQEIRDKAGASSSNPSGTVASAPPDASKRSLTDLFRVEMQKHGMGK